MVITKTLKITTNYIIEGKAHGNNRPKPQNQLNCPYFHKVKEAPYVECSSISPAVSAKCRSKEYYS